MEVLHVFLETYNEIFQSRITVPLCIGVQILNQSTKSFGHVPIKIKRELELGKSPTDIAYEFIDKALSEKFNCIYLLPSLLPSGSRGYEEASNLIKHFK